MTKPATTAREPQPYGVCAMRLEELIPALDEIQRELKRMDETQRKLIIAAARIRAMAARAEDYEGLRVVRGGQN